MSLVHLSHLTRPRMKYPVSWNLVISRRYLYAHRLFFAWIHSLVAQCADILRVRC